MAKELSAADIINLAKKAEGNPAKDAKVRALVQVVKVMGATDAALDKEFKKLESNQITSKFA